MKSLHEIKIPFEKEILTRENKINEYIFTALRTSHGCDLSSLKSHYDYDLKKINPEYTQSLIGQKDTLRFTMKPSSLPVEGKFLADKISADLFIKANNL